MFSLRNAAEPFVSRSFVIKHDEFSADRKPAACDFRNSENATLKLAIPLYYLDMEKGRIKR